MEHAYKALYLFCGIGGGALGFQQAQEEYKGIYGKFETICGIDCDPEVCKDFENITGSRAVQMDLFSRKQYIDFHGEEPPEGWKEATHIDIIRACKGQVPDIIFLSPPCKGYSGLLPEKNAKSEKYQALNQLVVRAMFLILEAFKDNLPPLILLENVPRIKTRGKALLHQVRTMLMSYGYQFTEGYHDCGEIGGLAQHRKRYLLICRNPKKIPGFVYQPPQRRVKAIGEVIGALPMPDNEDSGPMHRLPRLQWKTWVRLALIPAGGDWRDLERECYANLYQVVSMNGPSTAITGAMRPNNGALSTADPRLDKVQGYGNKYKIVKWTEPSDTITGSRIGSGATLITDPRLSQRNKRYPGLYKIIKWNEASSTVIGQTDLQCGALSIEDTRLKCKPRSGTMGVMKWDEAGKTVVGNSDIHKGCVSIADPRIPNECERGVFIIEALDGTWHRPLTTLELAVLQGFPTKLRNGTALKLTGNSDAKWRERIGNAVPVQAAQAVAETMLRAMLPVLKQEIVLGWTPIWVQTESERIQIYN